MHNRAFIKGRRRGLAVAAVGLVAVIAGAGSVLVTAGTDPGSNPTPRIAAIARSGCAPAPAPCGADNLDEFVIHAAYEAARRSIEQQATTTAGATAPTP
jgi:hypothetical protein